VNRVHVDMLKDAVGWRHGLGIAILPFQQGKTGAEVPFHNSIIGNFMVYQDRLETNLLLMVTCFDAVRLFVLFTIL